jgi:hypothetical protein
MIDILIYRCILFNACKYIYMYPFHCILSTCLSATSYSLCNTLLLVSFAYIAIHLAYHHSIGYISCKAGSHYNQQEDYPNVAY